MIDLRSDTVTRPTAPMRQMMAEAEVGDDVWGDDPTVKQLETQTAALLGKEAAMFVPSGTQSNLCALLTHCQRGDEYIVGDAAHTYRYEAGGAAVLGSIQPQPVRTLASGELDLDHVRSVIKPDDQHFAMSRLLSIENTHDGRVLSLEYQQEAASLAEELGLSLHLDGARLWNAAVALGVEPSVVAEPFDSVSVCLSKGLGAPVGSVLVANAEFVERARRWRKMLGGGMRQAGILAAAGIYAIENNIGRLAEDHAKAKRLADGLAAVDHVTIGGNATNMVFADFGTQAEAVTTAAQENNILVAINGSSCRMVTHLDQSDDDIAKVIEVFGNAAS